MIATGGTVDLAEEIIDDTCLVLIIFVNFRLLTTWESDIVKSHSFFILIKVTRGSSDIQRFLATELTPNNRNKLFAVKSNKSKLLQV